MSNIEQLTSRLSNSMSELGSSIVRMQQFNPNEYQALTHKFDTATGVVERLTNALRPRKRKHGERYETFAHAEGVKTASDAIASQCRVASGAWGAEPALFHSRRSFTHIGIGMMVPPLNTRTLEFLRCASETWMPVAGSTLDLLILVDCRRNASLPDLPLFSAPHLPRMHPRCYSGRIQINVDDFAKEDALLRQMLQDMPGKTFYMTIDLDTMLLPLNLFNFLSLLRSDAEGGSHLYFGSDEISTRIPGRSRLLRSQSWLAAKLRLSRMSKNPDVQIPAVATYAQGGAKGFSGAALKLIVQSGCLQEVGSLPCQDGLCIHKKEDATVGLCALALGIPLVNCKCFHAWGPCNIYNTSSCNDHMAKSHLCRYPITIHKLRKVDWYRRWWTFLRLRG